MRNLCERTEQWKGQGYKHFFISIVERGQKKNDGETKILSTGKRKRKDPAKKKYK
jgi:hypothetical protein